MCRGMRCLLIHDIRHHKSDISLSSLVQLLIFTVVERHKGRAGWILLTHGS